MALYRVKVEYPAWPASNEVRGRSRRDAAALLFERAVYAAIKGDAALDTLRGRLAYLAGQRIVSTLERGDFVGVARVAIGGTVISVATI